MRPVRSNAPVASELVFDRAADLLGSDGPGCFQRDSAHQTGRRALMPRRVDQGSAGVLCCHGVFPLLPRLQSSAWKRDRVPGWTSPSDLRNEVLVSIFEGHYRYIGDGSQRDDLCGSLSFQRSIRPSLPKHGGVGGAARAFSNSGYVTRIGYVMWTMPILTAVRTAWVRSVASSFS